MEAAQAAGVSMVTHLFNAMPAFHPRARPLIAPFIPLIAVTHLFNAMPAFHPIDCAFHHNDCAFHPCARPLIAPFIPASDYCVRLSEFDSL